MQLLAQVNYARGQSFKEGLLFLRGKSCYSAAAPAMKRVSPSPVSDRSHTTGRIRAGEGTLIGNAGECYVMAELLKRGVIAALAPRNAPGFDILATKDGKDVRIRVKTKSEEWQIWRWTAKKDDEIFLHHDPGRDFVVLVDLAMDCCNLHYYIVPTEILNKWLQSDWETYIHKPRRNGQPRDSKSKLRSLRMDDDRLSAYSNCWDSLWT